MRKRGWLFLLLLILAAAASLAAAKSFDKKEETRKTFVSGIAHEFATDEALRPYSYNRQELEALFAGVNAEMKSSGTKIGSPNLAKRMEIYRKIFLNPGAIAMGRVYGRAHANKLLLAEQRYGVPKEVIVSILWLESGFARNLGDKDTLTALYATYVNSIVSGKSARSKEFIRQTAYFLALCKKEKWNPKKILGSSTGALGIPQFMPVAWWHYAADGDGDGKVNLFVSHPDAIFSAANYLSIHGWKQNHREAILKYNHDSAYAETILAYAEALKK
ncbi:MAG: lytic murein transglycosylase [Candidatus Niyogibacteria bacterium]|nr:lytic murein transglycosylase [Candidatus Niyogibacteria bacterium]